MLFDKFHRHLIIETNDHIINFQRKPTFLSDSRWKKKATIHCTNMCTYMFLRIACYFFFQNTTPVEHPKVKSISELDIG